VVVEITFDRCAAVVLFRMEHAMPSIRICRTAATPVMLLALVMLSSTPLAAFAEEPAMSIVSQASSGPLGCAIHRVDHGDATEFRGVLTGRDAVAGQFRFSVAKTGPSGTSNINQANPFTLAAGGEAQVAQVTVNRDGASHVTIEFSATAEGGVTCRAQVTS
jgi:hypothetical protein